MIKYTSTTQNKLAGFKTPFETALDPNNRWVKLTELVPWDEFAQLYIRTMSKRSGRKIYSPRLVLGTLIIKHIKSLNDRDTLAEIQENPYLHYFVGLDGFTTYPLFDSSLFVHIRKRVNMKTFDKLTQILIKPESLKEDERHLKNPKKKKLDGSPINKGKLQLDATVADPYIKYPTDTDLLNKGRKKLEKILDTL